MSGKGSIRKKRSDHVEKRSRRSMSRRSMSRRSRSRSLRSRKEMDNSSHPKHGGFYLGPNLSWKLGRS